MNQSLSLLYKGTLIFFIVATHVLGLMAFLVYRNSENIQQNLMQRISILEADLDHDRRGIAALIADIDLMKQLIGHDYEVIVMTGDEKNPETVVGAMHADIALAGEDLEPKTMSAAIRKLAATDPQE